MDTRQIMSILLFFAAGLMLFISFLSYRKRHLPVAKTMILIMLGAAFYALGYAFEILSRSLSEMKFWLQVEYLGIPFITTLWLFLVIQFTGAAARFRVHLALLLFVVPVTVFFLHLTNEWHHLIYKRYILNEDASIPLYTTIKGPWYEVHTLYNYSMILCGILLFIPMYWRALPIVRKQIVILILGAAAPLLLNLIFWSGWNVDLTPFGFAVSGVVYIWGIYRFNLLRLTPLALTKMFETIQNGVVLLDYEDQIVSYNRAAEEVLPELGATKRYPAHVRDVLMACPELLEHIRVSSERDERFPFQRFQTNRNKYYICSLSFIFETGTTLIGKMLMFSDITEMKENEVRLRETARQLSELNAFKDKLFTVVAHDIRDPIALLVNLTELLGEELTAADAEHADLLQEIKDQVRSTYHLVENLLDWYRGQNGKVVFRPLAWNVQQVVRQALSLSGARAGMKQIRMTEKIDETLTVSADKEMLDLILRNLLSNAIKFIEIGGEIEIGAVLKGDLIVVSVRDNGAGIDEKTSKLLRQEEPFFKSPVDGDEEGKTRFGLVLTREFVRINGGSLWFDSVPGNGTTFSFTLPGSAGGRDTNDSSEAEAETYEGYIGG